MPKLTNEEMALLIQKGHTEYYTELWTNTEKLTGLLVNKFYNQYSDRCTKAGITVEDLKQCGFFALINAVNAYTPEKEFSFTTYINFHALRNFKAAIGLISKKQDVFYISQSLDMPIGDEDKTTLAENISDPVDNYKATEDKIFNEQLAATLEKCIFTLNLNEQNVINGRYFNGLTLENIGAINNISVEQVRSIENKALRKLRNGENYTRLKSFADEIFSRAIRNTGINSFKNNQASSVELTVDFMERHCRKADNGLNARKTALISS